ncbi:REP element-mobilizing transposase RayT [Breznakibacter xylanolyticus]|uniref:REP element-mobilizing transposase RayT n=1 Tax=Breznakibacter xylanolyticus TaxID=990 RepID=A0A2W7NLF6_9BACT|nr:transposase [Breznakibacter xylanolyticus]PZX20343.1 REP element-mobilizing transposase RayT [Breznakibacter xylanolyticus]
MSQLFQNKYRIASARLQCWDYRWAAAYFITICTHNRACCLGQVTEGCMQLSPVGVMADVFWHEIKNHVAHVQLDAFVVMPNHVHGILILNECGDDVDTVETGHALSLPKTIGQSRYQRIGHRSVSSIIGSYKSAVTKHAHRLGYHFGWQTRYWDHIIRDQPSFQRIQTYIVNNPAKWGDDRFHR